MDPKSQVSWSLPANLNGKKLRDSAPEQDVEDLFPWYKSTGGPGLSVTLTNEALTLLPVANLLLASKGINIIPSTLNLFVTLGVFLFFAIRSAKGYVKAKHLLGGQLIALKQLEATKNRQLESLQKEMAASASK